MIRLQGQLICGSDEDVRIVRAFLPEHIRLSRAEPGCLSFEVIESADPRVWQVRETFRDRASFDGHQTRTRESAWFAATLGIKRAFHLEELDD